MVSFNVSFFQNGCFKSKAKFNVLGALFFLAENAFFDFRSALPNLVAFITPSIGAFISIKLSIFNCCSFLYFSEHSFSNAFGGAIVGKLITTQKT